MEYADLTRKRLEQLGVHFVDVTGINPEGLFYDEADRAAVSRRFREAHVDGLLIAHCNFGTEYVCARLAKELNVPVLLWGPRDECPDENGVRLRDSQCGLFATGKVLRRFGVPFSYLSNCRLEDPAFEQGLMAFLAVCNVVRTFRSIRILQIGPRPFDFWSTMCNEGELLERFHIQLAPIPLPELKQEVQRALADGDDVQQVVDYCRAHMNICVTEEELRTIAAMKVAIRRLADRYGCSAAAIQCWNALQTELGVMPCAANSLLNEEGFPVVCETDIHGAITALLAEAACLDDTRSFFADWTVRHPETTTPSFCSTAAPGPSPWPTRSPASAIRWRSVIPAPWQHGRKGQADHLPLRRRQRRILPAAGQRTGRGRPRHQGHLHVGGGRQLAPAGGEDRQGPLYPPLCGRPQGRGAGAV